MKKGFKVFAVIAAAAGASAAAALTFGDVLWRRETEHVIARLFADKPDSTAFLLSPERLAELPAPVARYFAFALTSGQPLIRSVRAAQTGEFRAGGFDAPWSPFTAEQHFAAGPPGFVWDAHIRMAPLLTIRVRDSYLEGTGTMQGRIAALIPIIDQSGGPELAAGALHRYLAEAVWFPTALLPGQGVEWEAMDDTTARATLTDSGIAVSLEFQFGEKGEILRAFTPERYRDVKGTAVPTPWACCYGNYAKIDGVMVPLQGEVEWILPEGRLSYCRVNIRNIQFGRDSLR